MPKDYLTGPFQSEVNQLRLLSRQPDTRGAPADGHDDLPIANVETPEAHAAGNGNAANTPRSAAFIVNNQ